MKLRPIHLRVVAALPVFMILTWTAQARGDLFIDATAVNSSVFITAETSGVPQLDNDNFVGLSPNFVNLSLDVSGLDGLDKADLVFTPLPTAGTTEYTSTTAMQNLSGVPWDSFSLLIGTGSYNGPGTADTFIPYAGASSLLTNYDSPDFDSLLFSDVFTNSTWNAHSISFSGGIVNPGQTVLVRFPVDVPRNQPFTTFRGVITTVPEPGAAALIAVAGIVQLSRRRVRSQRHRLM